MSSLFFLLSILHHFYHWTNSHSLRQLFKSFRSVDQPDQQAMRLQRNKLAEIITLGLKLWEKPHQLIPALEHLGRQHYQYGVRDEYYEDVWIALSEVLSEAFGRFVRLWMLVHAATFQRPATMEAADGLYLQFAAKGPYVLVALLLVALVQVATIALERSRLGY